MTKFPGEVPEVLAKFGELKLEKSTVPRPPRGTNEVGSFCRVLNLTST